MSSRKWSEDELLMFVQLYRQEECLWNLRAQTYRNKQMRSTAIKNICAGMKIDGLTADGVKSKIKALRSTYYLECDKIKKSTTSGAEGNVYVPKVKWFSELHEFIKDVAIKRRTTDNYDRNSENTLDTTDSETSSLTENIDPSTTEPSLETPSTHIKTNPPPFQRPRAKRSKLSQMASIVTEMRTMNDNVNKEENDFDIFGMSVASQLKKLSEEQATIARDEIQSVLTRCRLTDIRSRNTNSDRSSFFNSQFSSSSLLQPCTITQLSQSSPALTTSSSLGFHPNYDMSPIAEYQHNTEDSNIIAEAFNST